MCGITGCVLGEGEAPSADVLDRMTDALAHRGPDDRGTWIKNNVGLGFRRLSIIDLSAAGHQPMLNDDESICQVFNGEVYNFQALRNNLEETGVRFRSRTDSEVVLKLYQATGMDFLGRLRGMFALAIWDEEKRRLLLARDRAGKKPLFYYYDGKRILFGSEIKSIVKHPGLDLTYDYDAIDEYFSFGYISAPRSVYSKVRKVRPGHFLTFEHGKLTESAYWTPRLEPVSKSFDRVVAVEQLRSLLNDAVKIRMVSDVPLGAFLSGGVDSSAVVAFMAANSSQPIKTFSIGFEESDFNETRYARCVAEHFGTDHHEEIVRPDYASILEDIIQDFDEPFGDSSALPTYVVSKITRRHVTVALSGDGGDELFGGYDLYGIALNDRRFDAIPVWAKQLLLAASDAYPRSLRGAGLLRRMAARTPQLRYIERFFTFNPADKRILYSQALQEHTSRTDPFFPKATYYAEAAHLDFLNQIGYNDFKHYLPDDILVKVDRMSMLNSLEARSPLLDHHIIEFAYSLPAAWKCENGNTKVLMKEALKGIVPDEILVRKKMGFAVPVKHWFADDLFVYARDLLRSREVRESGFLNMSALEKFLRVHKAGLRDVSSKLWCVVAFALFLQGEKRRGTT